MTDKTYTYSYELGSKNYVHLNLLESFERTLRLYDMRGDSSHFTKEYARRVGRALGTRLEAGSFLAISGDNRESTEPLKKNLIRGINDTGVHVLDLGMAPTPVTYLANFLIKEPAVAGSVMITASHCERHENGLKIVMGQRPLYGEGLKAIALEAMEGKFRHTEEPGSRRIFNANPAYNQMLSRRVERLGERLDSRLLETVVIDGGHGLIGPRAVKIYDRDLGLYVHKMYCSPDRSFSAHSPDPARKRNMINLASTVAAYQEQSIIGLAFDGDGDRLGVVDSEGRIYFGRELTMFFLARLFKSPMENRFAADTQLPLPAIRWIVSHLENGLCIIREPGNPQFKETILEEKLVFGGETSGHFFFTPLEDEPAYRHVAADDGLLASLELVDFILESGKPFHSLATSILKEVDDGSTLLWSKRYPLPDEHRMAVLGKVRDRFQNRIPDLGPTIRFACTESLKHLADDLSEALTIRPSQTEAVLKVQWEGPPKRKRAAKTELKRDLAECYRKAGADVPAELA